MTSTQSIHNLIVQPTMVDDDMEISSDNGQMVGDDDIDIDIDLTAGQHDEDDVLEDAHSDIGIEDSFDTNVQEGTGADDLMVDDENTSFPMEDDNMLEESFNDFQAEDVHVPDLAEEKMIDRDAGPHLDESASDHLEPTDSLPLKATQDNSAIPENIENTTASTVPMIKTVHEATPVAEDQQASSSGLLPLSDATNPPVPSLQTMALATNETLSESKPTTLNENNEEDVSTNENLNHEEDYGTSGSRGETKGTLYDTNKVIVVYKDTEYSLVSTAESDDPDSFFFGNDSVTKEPLSEFIDGLRNVLQEEIPLDEEICLVVEDLGLEINEASAKSCDVTFSQIFDLHELLLRNDGVENLSPLYLAIFIKPAFTKRFGVLSKSAAEGNGLSSLVAYDKQSESYAEDDDTGEADFTFALISEENTSPFVTDESINNAEDSVESAEVETLEESGPNKSQPWTEITIEDGHRAEDTTIGLNQSGTQYLRETDISNGSHDLTEYTTISEQQTHGEHTAASTGELNGELDEDGDLIDYEDEEYVQSKKDTTHGGPKLHLSEGNGHNAEYVAINQDIRRRSLSLAADEADGNNFGESRVEDGTSETRAQPPSGQVEDASADPNIQANEEDLYHNDAAEESYLENGDAQLLLEGSEGLSANLETQDPETETYLIITEDDPNSSEPKASDDRFDTEQAPPELFEDNNRNAVVDDLDYDVQLPIVEEASQATNEGHVDTGENYLDDEIGYEEEADPTTEPTESETTLVGDDSNNVQGPDVEDGGHDEIDYDDYEEQGANETAAQLTLDDTSSISSGQNGKRTRSHVEQDEPHELTNSAKTKRARS